MCFDQRCFHIPVVSDLHVPQAGFEKLWFRGRKPLFHSGWTDKTEKGAVAALDFRDYRSPIMSKVL